MTFIRGLVTTARSLVTTARSLVAKIPSVGTFGFYAGNHRFLRQKPSVSAFETVWEYCFSGLWKKVKAA